MKILSKKRSDSLIIALEGELDHHSAKGAISQISTVIDTELPLNVTLNLKDLSFMDSSAIALILHTYRKLNDFSANLKIEDVPKQGYKVLNAAGIPRLIPTTQLQ